MMKYDHRNPNDEHELLINNIESIKLNLIKEVYEIMGFNLGSYDDASIEYHNYLIDDNVILGEDGVKTLLPFDQYIESKASETNTETTGGTVMSDTGVSQEMLNAIARYETGHNFGYSMTSKDLNGYDLGDAKGHRTFGYGLLFHPNGKYMDSIKSSWTQPELEQLFMETVSKMSGKVKSWMQSKSISLNQNQIDALTCALFNFGTGFLGWSVCKMIEQNPNNSNIHNRWAHFSDKQGIRFPGLIKRRNFEANWYFSK